MKKATRQHTKTHNSRLLLKTIYQQGPVSRADIARETHLTRTTVSDIVAEFMNDGLIEEVGYGPSVGGKPPILLSVVDNARCLIGVDLADSEFRGCVVDLRGKIVHSLKMPVNDSNGEAALNLAYALIDELVTAATSPLLGIGIGTPGLMDARKGIVRNAVNLDWCDLPLRDLLEVRYNLPVYIANDSQAAALGEYIFGRNQEVPNLILIKVGRGISAGIVLNGQLHYGDGSGAGEIGHVRVVDGGEQCLCGNYGCLETVVSSRAIIRQARESAQNNPDSLLHNYAATPEDINTNVVLQAFAAGDEAIGQIIDDVGKYLSISIANLVGVLNIHQILVGGSVARFGERLLDPIRQELQHRSLAALAGETRVESTNLDANIVILGASALLLTNELGLI
jgi:glucokinase-like ROK family protein